MRCPACHRRVGPTGRCLFDGTAVAPEAAEPPGPAPALEGAVVGDLIGRGGFAGVWQATVDGLRCAIKVAHRPGDRIAERFQREADALAAVGPPWVPALIRAGRLADGRPFLLLERLEGRTLADELAERAEPPPLERVSVLADGILAALEVVHARGIVHRDLKPENVFCEESGGVRLFDFGLVRAAEGAGDLTRIGAAVGSSHYMAPEQLAGQAIDERADLYSFGILVYELLTLRVPFAGDGAAIAVGHRMHRPPRPSTLAKVPRALEAVVLSCLAKSPEQRPASAAVLRRDLAQAMAAAADATAPARASPPTATLTGRKKELLVLLAIDGAIALDALERACAGSGGFVAQHRGARSVAVFISAGESPMAAAIAAASALPEARHVIHVTEAVMRRRASGPPAVYSADVEQPERWIPQAWDGLVLTAAATRALGGEEMRPAPGLPGFFRLADRAARTALVGRDEVLAAAAASWASCRATGTPVLFTLVGEPGVGKSRMVAEIAARLDGARVLSLWIPSRLSRDADPTIARLGGELGLAEADWTLRAVGDALRRAAGERPTALLLDDAHRAVDTTLDLVEYATLDAHATPLWVLVAADERLELVRRRWGARAERHDRVLLAPLDQAAAMAMTAELLRPAEFPPADALRRIAGWSGGNPQRLIEIARALHREGIVRRRPGSEVWYLATAELDRLPASPGAQWLAGSQLAALSPELAALARLAAGLGMEFERDELQALQDALEKAGSAPTPLDTDRGLEALVAAGIALRAGDQVSFASASLYEGMYALLSAEDRAMLHGVALDFWLGRRAGGAEDPAVLRAIARHAAGAGQEALAAGTEVALGELALAQHRAVDAELHFGAALRSLGDRDPMRARALFGLGRIRYRIGRTAESIEDLAAAAAIAGEDRALLAAILLEQATALDWAGRYAESAQRAEEAVPLVPDDGALAGQLALARGRALAREARYADAIPLLARAAEIGDDDTRTVALVLLAPVLALVDRLEESQARFTEVIELCTRIGDRIHLGAALDNRVFLWSKLDRHERATEDLRAVIQLAREMGQPTLECRALHNLADVLFQRGDEEEALELAHRARRLEERLGGAPVSFVTLLTARIHALRGEREQAAALLDWIDRSCTLEGVAWFERAMLRLFLADAPRADWLALVDRARREVSEDHLGVIYFWARAAEAGGRMDEAREALEAARAPLESFASWRRRFTELEQKL